MGDGRCGGLARELMIDEVGQGGLRWDGEAIHSKPLFGRVEAAPSDCQACLFPPAPQARPFHGQEPSTPVHAQVHSTCPGGNSHFLLA